MESLALRVRLITSPDQICFLLFLLQFDALVYVADVRLRRVLLEPNIFRGKLALPL
jgi:hypothetical protein